jgi:hypothetical protein
MGLLVIVLVALAVSAVLAHKLYYQWRFRSHQGIGRVAFQTQFAQIGIADEVSGAVYDYYKSLAVWSAFEVSASDDLERTYGHAPEELDSSLDVILGRLKLSLPPDSVLAEQDRVHKTVADVVRLVAWIADHQAIRS